MHRNYLWILIPCVLIIGVVLYLKFTHAKVLEPWFREQLQRVVARQTDSTYHLAVGKIRADITTGYITIEDGLLSVDSAQIERSEDRTEAFISLSIPHLVIRGFGLLEALGWKPVNLRMIELDSASLQVWSDSVRNADTIPSLHQRMLKAVRHLAARDVRMRNLKVTVRDASAKGPDLRLPDTDIHLHDVFIHPETLKDSTRFLFAKDARVAIRDVTHLISDSLYAFHLDSVIIEGSDRKCTLHGLLVEPFGGVQAFKRKVAGYRDRYDLRIPQVIFTGVDWFAFFDVRRISIEQGILPGGEIAVHADRTLPPAVQSKVGNYPHQLLMDIGYEVQLDTLTVDRLSIKYSELSRETMQTGVLTFENAAGSIRHISNIPARIQENRYCIASAHARLHGSANLHALFKFDLRGTKEGIFSVDFHLGNMDGTKLNPVSRALSMQEFRSLQIHELSGRVDGSNYKAEGKISFLYDSLDLVILKPDQNHRGVLQKKEVATFLADKFLLQKQNTSSDSNAEPKEIRYTRDVEKSMFNLVWKTVYEGMKQTMLGRNG